MMTRRDFLWAAGATAGAMSVPGYSLAQIKSGYAAPRRPSASNRVNLAVIGCGTQGFANMGSFLQDPRVQVTVVCDPVLSAGKYSYRSEKTCGRAPAKAEVDSFYKNKDCRMVADFREVLADPTIDAVLIATPDHWHALQSVLAMKAGKHVYCQKPMTLGISEGKEMVRVAKETGVTFQVGSQQRSSSEFRVAAELVINGYLGECMACDVGLPGGNKGMYGHEKSVGRDLSPVPDYFQPDGMWDMWQGPAKHWDGNKFIQGIHDPMCWRWNSRTGGGIITDWGAHWIDLLQWTLDTDRTGPVAIENMTTDLDNDEVFDWAQNFDYDMVYADGFVAHVSSKARNGLTFHGEKGDIYFFPGKLERPDFLAKWSEKKDLKDTDRRLYRARDGHGHEMDFVDGIYENRPICTDCEIGHRSIAACHIANICERLRLKKLTWDPVAERFTGDHAAEANRLLEVPHSNGWKLI